MSSSPTSRTQAAREQDALFSASFSAARKLRSQSVTVRPHRALTALKVTPYLLAQAVVLPVLFCLLLWWARLLLDHFWQSCMLFWARELGLPFTLPAGLLQNHKLSDAEALVTAGPRDLASALILLASVLGFALSYRLKKSLVPLRYPLRIVCLIQALSVLYFWFSPTPFPYDVSRHSKELLTMGYAVMMAAPVMLGIGYYILNESLWKKLGYTALILLFFTLMVPHQVLLHAVILHHLSLVFMPVLYFCFGAVFDGLVFVALYSWAASNTSIAATR